MTATKPTHCLPGVYLGPPREYPKERPQTCGRYLAWIRCEKYKAGGYYVLAWYENDIFGFAKWDKTITHWLPMPPAILIEEALNARHPDPPQRNLAAQALGARDEQREKETNE